MGAIDISPAADVEPSGPTTPFVHLAPSVVPFPDTSLPKVQNSLGIIVELGNLQHHQREREAALAQVESSEHRFFVTRRRDAF